MNWDALSYERWFETPAGRFALEQERRLLEGVVAGWPRRCKTLLEVGCGTGIFLELLYHTGFDVTGVDRSQAMVDAARERLGKRAEIRVANGESLPFEDKEFDYVVLWTVLEFCDDPMAVLREAARVASRGVLIGFLNRQSLYYLSHGRGWGGRRESTLRNARWFSYWEMRRMAETAMGRPPSLSRSVLPGPSWTWRDRTPWKYLNCMLCMPLFGAFTAMRIDFVDEKPLTPVGTLKIEPAGMG